VIPFSVKNSPWMYPREGSDSWADALSAQSHPTNPTSVALIPLDGTNLICMAASSVPSLLSFASVFKSARCKAHHANTLSWGLNYTGYNDNVQGI
jgi:hypothetical protein